MIAGARGHIPGNAPHVKDTGLCFDPEGTNNRGPRWESTSYFPIIDWLSGTVGSKSVPSYVQRGLILPGPPCDCAVPTAITCVRYLGISPHLSPGCFVVALRVSQASYYVSTVLVSITDSPDIIVAAINQPLHGRKWMTS